MRLAICLGFTVWCVLSSGCTRKAAQPSPEPPNSPTGSHERSNARAPAEWSRLPREAAALGWVRLSAMDVVPAWSGARPPLPEWLAAFAPTRTVGELLRQLGIDPDAPVALALVGPDLAAARRVVDDLAKGSAADAPTADVGEVLTVHAEAHALPEVDLRAKALLLAKTTRAVAIACPGDPRCARFGAGGPEVVLSREGLAVAARSAEGRVHVTVAFGTGPDLPLDVLLDVLAQRGRLPQGVAAGRCPALDPAASLSVCVDAERGAELGAAMGFAAVARAVADVPASAVRAELATRGAREALRALELARPEKPLLDDGTLSVTFTSEGYRVIGSWAVTDPAARGRIPADRCADTPDLVGLVPTLAQAFPERGADFRDVAERVKHLHEGGAGALLPVIARTWPNFLGGIIAEPKATAVLPSAQRACLALINDRLELRVTGQPFFLGSL